MSDHHHPPGHTPHAPHTHDFTVANKTYFDDHAHEDMNPVWREMARKEVDAMRAEWPALFDKEHTVLLDFACGIGMISEQLITHVKSIVGVDISQKSVDRYNALATSLSVTPGKMKAVCLELKGEPGELDDVKFDLVVCCAAYHHFASIADITRVLAAVLKPGGSLIVADIKAEADGRELFPKSYHEVVPHKHGIDEAQLRATFEGAGLVGFEMKDQARESIQHAIQHDGIARADMQWFVARGVKPAQGRA